MPDLGFLSDLNMGTVIVDGAAVFLLSGMALGTGHFRERGRKDDRIFTWMLLVAILLGLTDALNYWIEGRAIYFANTFVIVSDTIFTLAFEAFCFLFILFLDYRAYEDEERTKKLTLLYSIPAMLTAVMILINPFFGFLFSMDERHVYHFGAYYNLIYIAPAVYAVMAIVYLWKLGKNLLVLFGLMVIIRVTAGLLIRGISLTALFFAVGLAFIHIQMMNHSFYEDKEGA